MKPIHWGLIGESFRVRDFATALQSLSRDDHEIIAFGAMRQKAAELANTFSARKSHASYEEVATDSDIDIVYIGTSLPTSHFELCKLMLENGKHVLCESPLTLLLEHTEELIRLSVQKKLFFQEAIHNRFLPTSKKLREEIRNGKIGSITLITADFGLLLTDFERTAHKDLGHGIFTVSGSYLLQFVVALTESVMPEKIKAVGVLNKDGCDMSTAITLQYKNGPIVQLICTGMLDTTYTANVFGTKGSIKLDVLSWEPVEYIVRGKKEEIQRPLVRYNFNAALALEAEEAKRCVDQQLLESSFITHKEMMIIARIGSEVRKQTGVSYEELYQSQRT